MVFFWFSGPEDVEGGLWKKLELVPVLFWRQPLGVSELAPSFSLVPTPLRNSYTPQAERSLRAASSVPPTSSTK